MNMLYTPLFTPPLDTAVGGERMTVQLVGMEKAGTNILSTLKNSADLSAWRRIAA